MNKIAEQLSPIMNDEELETLIGAHYLNQAQTLTTGAQANLLKLQELRGMLEGEDLQRWTDIKRTFKRNLLLGSAGGDSEIGQVIAQLTTFSEGLNDIRTTLDNGVKQLAQGDGDQANVLQNATMQQVAHAVAELAKFNSTLGEMKTMMGEGIKTSSSITQTGQAPQAPQKIEVVNKVPNIFLDIIRNQFRVLQTWMEPILKLAETSEQAAGLREAAKATQQNYEKLIKQIGDQDTQGQ